MDLALCRLAADAKGTGKKGGGTILRGPYHLRMQVENHMFESSPYELNTAQRRLDSAKLSHVRGIIAENRPKARSSPLPPETRQLARDWTGLLVVVVIDWALAAAPVPFLMEEAASQEGASAEEKAKRGPADEGALSPQGGQTPCWCLF